MATIQVIWKWFIIYIFYTDFVAQFTKIKFRVYSLYVKYVATENRMSIIFEMETTLIRYSLVG